QPGALRLGAGELGGDAAGRVAGLILARHLPRRDPAVLDGPGAGIDVDHVDVDRGLDVGRLGLQEDPVLRLLGDAADRGGVRVRAADAELADRQVARLRARLRVDPDVGLDRVRRDEVGPSVVHERAGVGDVVADLERGLLARIRVGGRAAGDARHDELRAELVAGLRGAQLAAAR